MYKRFVLTMMLALVAMEVRGAARVFAVTWDAGTNKWALDGTVAPDLSLATSMTYDFTVPSTAGGVFWLSIDDSINDTASALTASDGVTNNRCAPPCTITYTPLESDAGQTFYYISDTFQDAGADISISRCSTISTEADCGKTAGCGWRTTCVSCSSLTTSDMCLEAPTCGWCLSTDTETCMAETDNTCSSFLASETQESSLLYLLFLLVIPVGAAIILVASLVVKKANYKKRNEAMFRIEDEMSVLGGRPAADDNTL